MDDRVAEVDWAGVAQGMLVEHLGTAFWALPWAALSVLRRHHCLEAATYTAIAAALLLWSGWLLWTGLSDPVAAEQIRCWHF